MESTPKPVKAVVVKKTSKKNAVLIKNTPPVEAGEINETFIDGLCLNETALIKKISASLSIAASQVSSVIELLNEDCTVPFIARYRKERTGGLDEVQILDIEHAFESGKNLEERRIEIIRGVFDQGKLDAFLLLNIQKAQTQAELEDIYAPYKRKKKTRGMAAIEKGLEPLALLMMELEEEELKQKALDFVHIDAENEALSTPDVQAALQGAMDVIAERAAQDVENRAEIKTFYEACGKVVVKGIGDEEEKKKSVYQMYWDYSEPFSQIKPHRVLAINRGEREGRLEVSIEADVEGAVKRLQSKYSCRNSYHKAALEDGLKRLLSPAVLREMRANASDAADGHGIGVFSSNLANLLLQKPIKGTRVLGVDPGIRTGTKCAALDETGKYLGDFKIYNNKVDEAKKLILAAIKKYNIQLVAIGNGTGSKDAQEIVSAVISESAPLVRYTIVDEDGASVYSASEAAREEFPDLDLTIRGAISIGRRLQDPLAELVKIDPKSIGVGLYQHDVNQKRLSQTLDEVVSSVVNKVGVQLNTASVSLLKYVSGVNASLAKKIVKFRDEHGKIASRSQILEIPGMGPKSFEQCAGFLKIPESEDALDNTWVHPENYPIAREIKDAVTTTGNLTKTEIEKLKEKYQAGEQTIRDIVEELKKPSRDPREDYPAPILMQGVVTFEDLREGMTVTGKIKNVVDFGAFVDLGVKETALIHISELSDGYVKNPLDLIKVGDVFDFKIIGMDADRRRISLSRKSQNYKSETAKQQAPVSGGAKKTAAPFYNGKTSAPQQKGRDDDGTKYNAFAEAFKRMKDRERK
ncbi:MAG: RNA-binding transcriptional accessory protein [Spirochaetaceae bacterium]|jgi:uncharacterized protein|nr:RNA-binding transcriptional accessory protein [Spirochaetaceae bacterium]